MASPSSASRRVGPRGFGGTFGWTFFDPANLVSVGLLGTSAALVVSSMHFRGAGDWYMALGLYLCIAAFLRGYVFSYYHGTRLARVAVLTVLVVALSYTAILWRDRAAPFRALRDGVVVELPPAEGYEYAAVLHGVVALTLLVHAFLPRRWLVKVTDEVADRAGRDTAEDAPLESIDDPEVRARRSQEAPPEG